MQYNPKEWEAADYFWFGRNFITGRNDLRIAFRTATSGKAKDLIAIPFWYMPEKS